MLCLVLIGKKREREIERERERERNGQGAFFPEPDTPCWLCCIGFLRLLGEIKG
jgi:hypothetical protein